MKKNYLLVLLFLLGGFASYGQGKSQIKREYLSENGSPRLVEFTTGKEALPLSKAAEVLKTHLKLEQGEDMQIVEKGQDSFGYQHQKYQQFYKGIKVEFGTYWVHAKDGSIESINGEFKKVAKQTLKTEPGISEAEALQNATRHIGAQTYMWETEQNESLAKAFSNGQKETFYPKAELVILGIPGSESRDNSQQMALAYKFDIYAQQPVSRDYVYVNAHSGEIVLVNPIIKHAVANGSGDTRYSGNRTITTDSYNGSYRLRDYSRSSGIETYNMKEGTNYNNAVDFTDNDNSWTAAEYDNTAKDNAALDAHWGAQMTYDYWKNIHNRNSFDNNGATIKSYVHYDKNYDNAFWNGSVMTYGDGSDTYFDALTSLDVAAHEIGHAVCTYTADLVYSYESGAINEGFSDIWAATVEHFAAPEKQIWLIGEDIERRAGHQALRSMSDPKSEGQPDTYKGEYWYTGTGDNGGVHTNSGVMNHWFYILSVGKTGTNDIGNSYAVQSISIEKAAKIAYRLESLYLTSNSGYFDARTYSIKAAEDLFGAGSNEVIQTTNAWHAVGVGGKYGEISYCGSNGNNASYEWIAEVKIGAFTNASGSAGYTDFTSKTVELSAGSSFNISLTPGFSRSSYNEYWKIWIDYNKDGDFEDSGELAFDAGALSKTTVSGTINVPVSAENGTTRMRVSMKYNGAQTSCESFSYGEVEDYTVNISGGGTISCDTPASLSVSNISNSAATLNWGAVSDASSYQIQYRPTGTSTWLTTTSNTTSVSVNSLSASTEYEFQVASVCSSGTSAFSASTLFTTSTNAVPDVNAGVDQMITLPTNTASFTATATDTDGTIASYAWTTVSSPSGSTVTLVGQSTSTLEFTIDLAGAYTFQVTVTDDQGATASDQVNLTVNEATTNSAPVANAGVDQSITLPTNSATLNGSGSDSDGTISAYSWSQDSGPGTATFSSTSIANPTVSDLIAGTYVFSLTVTDDQGAVSLPDQVSVVVNKASLSLAAPSNLTAVGVSSNQVNLNWQDNSSDEEGFVLERATKSDFSGKVDYFNISANTTSYQNQVSNNKKGGGTFYYRIKAVKGSLSSEYSNVASVVPTLAAANTSRLSAYPNTFNKFVDLEIKEAELQEYTIKVYDLLGKVLYESSFVPQSVDVAMHRIELSGPAIRQGMYLIEVENKEKDFREIVRIVKTQ